MAKPSLSVCLITQNMAHFLPHVLAQVVPLAQEILVVDGGSVDGTPEIAASFANVRVLSRPFDGDMASQKNYAISMASCDWVLVVDSDELLGDDLRDRIPSLLQTRRYTHYKFPRYWIVSADPYTYVRSDKHYPDYQLRLFRNLEVFRYTGRSLVHTHFPRLGRGPGRKLKGSHIFHFDFLLQGRRERAAKVRRYVTIDPPSAATSQMYLWEDLPHRLLACEESLSGFNISDIPARHLKGGRELPELSKEGGTGS